MSGDGKKLRGLRFIATLVRGLEKRPATAREAMGRFGLSKCAANRMLRVLTDLGVLRIVDWVKRDYQGPPVRVYGLGTGPHADPPNRRTGKASSVTLAKLKHPSPELITFAALWRALEEPHTAYELTEMTGLMPGTIYKFVRHACSIGLIGVASWDMHCHMPTAEYQRGVVRNAPRPKRQSPRIKSVRDTQTEKGRRIHRLLTAGLYAPPIDRGLAA